jgi:hypothetical protein
MQLINQSRFLQKTLQRSLTTIGFFIVTSLGVLPVFSSLASTTWQVGGQPTLVLEYADAQAKTRIAQLDRRLAEIVANLDPSRVWTVDTVPALSSAKPVSVKPLSSKPNAKPNTKPVNVDPVNLAPVRSVTIRVQGQPLLEVTEEDARIHNATSVSELALNWLQALTYALGQPVVKQRLVGTIGMPSQLVYKGTTYSLNSEVVGDRGLFRTDGQRVNGKVVFWEVTLDKRVYVTTSSIRESVAPASPAKIFILNRYMQFVPYSK